MLRAIASRKASPSLRLSAAIAASYPCDASRRRYSAVAAAPRSSEVNVPQLCVPSSTLVMLCVPSTAMPYELNDAALMLIELFALTRRCCRSSRPRRRSRRSSRRGCLAQRAPRALLGAPRRSRGTTGNNSTLGSSTRDVGEVEDCHERRDRGREGREDAQDADRAADLVTPGAELADPPFVLRATTRARSRPARH